ncbi:hypothetical protein ACT3QO_04460 [Psychrobacter sp. AOP7-D1-15]|uniref:hypothetical protein n=1 Tax=Psychrobacter TaxID=497 RepID=UPI0018661CC7|nr:MULTISPECIES: hypothetical protein [Psychrobacter]
MSSIQSKSNKKDKQPGRAEIRFLEAFERLKVGKPELLPKGTSVTQNNVAKEAGVNPSALRRSRYPDLVDKIQSWIDENKDNSSQQSTRQKSLAKTAKNRSLKQQLDDIKMQNDIALSKLMEAERMIIELTLENERLKSRLPAIEATKMP